MKTSVALSTLLFAFTHTLVCGPASWQLRSPLPVGQRLSGVAFGNGTFVASDLDQGAWTSTDGLSWTNVDIQIFADVLYANGLFVAIGPTFSSSVIYTSPDGQDWTSRGSFPRLNSVTYGNGMYLVSGDDVVVVSTNGMDWEERPLRQFARVHDAAYGNGIWLAVATQQSGQTVFELILRSTNAVEWTPMVNDKVLHAIAFGNGVFVAAGEDGAIRTSSDGSNWTHTQINPRTSQPVHFQVVAFENERFLVGGLGGEVLSSTNGMDWTFGCLFCNPNSIFHYPFTPISGFAFGQGRFIAVGEGGTVYASDDAREWFNRSWLTRENLHGVTYGNGTFVAVGLGDSILTSPDGVEWMRRFAPKQTGSLPNLYGTGFGNGRFVAGGGPDPYLAASSDGILWEPERTLALPIGANFRGVTFGDGLFVAVGERQHQTEPSNFVARIAISTNTLDWSHQTLTDVSPLLAVTHGEGLFVAVGEAGTILTSSDAQTWTSRSSTVTSPLRSVTYLNGRFLAGGDVGLILASEDGISWSPASPTSFDNRGLGSAPGEGVVVVGDFNDAGRIHWSPDGLSWPGSTFTFSNALNAVTFANGTWIAVGDGGVVLQSGKMPQFYDPKYTTNGFEARIEWEPGRVYTIQRSTDLRNWFDLETQLNPGPVHHFRDNSPPAGISFYRVISR